MKLENLPTDEIPTKEVRLRLANSGEEISVGLRLLTIRERADAMRAARSFAVEEGVEKWDPQDSVCALGLFLSTVSRAAFSWEEGPSVPFATAESLLNHPCIGQENLGYLYESYESFEEELHIRTKQLSDLEVAKTCVQIASGDNDFLERLRPGILRALLRILAAQYVIWTNIALLDTSEDSSSQGSQVSTESEKTPTTSSDTSPISSQ